LDTIFGTGGIETISASVIPGWKLALFPIGFAVQSNNQILILTLATSNSTGTEDFAVIRLNPNGGLDTSFGNNSGIELFNFDPTNWTVQDQDLAGIAIGPAGTIVIAGTVLPVSSSLEEFGIARLTTSGALDTSFNSGGSMPGTQEVAFNSGTAQGNASPVGVVVNSAGGIVVAGNVIPTTIFNIPLSNITVASLNVNGSVGWSETLPSYNANDDDSASAIALEGTQIVIAGSSEATPFTSTGNEVDELTVTRLNPKWQL